MWAATTVPSGPGWVQTLLAVVAILGGGGGLAALATVLSQRRKFKADTADVLTDTALTLVEPLRTRVTELEAEQRQARVRMSEQDAEISELRAAVRDLTATMRKWRAAILSPTARVETLRQLVNADPGVNGRNPD